MEAKFRLSRPSLVVLDNRATRTKSPWYPGDHLLIRWSELVKGKGTKIDMNLTSRFVDGIRRISCIRQSWLKESMALRECYSNTCPLLQLIRYQNRCQAWQCPLCWGFFTGGLTGVDDHDLFCCPRNGANQLRSDLWTSLTCSLGRGGCSQSRSLMKNKNNSKENV